MGRRKLAVWALFRRLLPPWDELVREPQVVENSRDDRIHDLLHCLRTRVERGIRGEDGRAREKEKFKILQVDQAQRRLSRDKNELLSLL